MSDDVPDYSSLPTNPVSQALERAKDFGKSGDFSSFAEAIVGSGILDGLKRRVGQRWPRLHPDDVDLAVGHAFDQLYADLKAGKTIISVISWLFKVAMSYAAAQWACRQRDTGYDYDFLEQHQDDRHGSDDQQPHDRQTNWDYEDRRRHAIEAARKLLKEIGHLNAQRVMSLILDAIEAEREDISDREISNSLGDVSQGHVKKLRQRAFERLARVAREKGWGDLIVEHLEKHQIHDMSEDDEGNEDDGEGRDE
jgi:DNA-directed RNA polymerase specialized sigma24 family protein